MSVGLGGVTRGLQAGCTQRRRGVLLAGRRFARRPLRPLLGVLLAIVGVLAPVESAELPAQLDSVAGTSAVLAQRAVMDGIPGGCPTNPVPWSPTLAGSECQLDMEPCLRVPVIVSSIDSYVLRFSTLYHDTDGLTLNEYPGFCELRILDVNDPAAYATCQAMTGFAVVEQDVDRIVGGVVQTDALCRLLQPAACPVGVRIDVDNCRAIQRRPWNCPGRWLPTNEYNRCYLPPPQFTGTVHPACGNGAPVFVAQDCADYVGDDFPAAPAVIDCVNDFPTANPPDPNTALSRNPRAGTASDYWCEFDTRFLNVVCHGLNPPPAECAQSLALCLKRATETGGCRAIANSIRCRSLELDYDADLLTAIEVRLESCQPCIVLPFRPLPPDCPDDLSAEPRPTGSTHMFRLLRIKLDYNVASGACTPDSNGNLSAACLAQPNCADPARGRITWSSTHFSQVAVVNTPVIVSVREIPAELRRGGMRFSGGRLRLTRYMLPYPVSPAGSFGYSMARFGNIDPADGTLDTVNGVVSNTGECLFKREPQFQLTIRELWPDNPADLADIDSLIGPNVLDWWRALTPQEREDRTLERGLGWWPRLSPADQDARVVEQTQLLDCDYSLPVWCRWTPTRTGYFKVTAGAAWISTRWDRAGRRIMTASQAAQVDNALQDPATRARIADQLAAWGATPAAVGLRDTLDGVLPLAGLNAETMYTSTESRFSCGGTDIRVYCTSRSNVDSGNYTETDPIGIAVHEVRVATRGSNS